MANPLDELNAPYNPDGLEARVIHKQLPVQIGIESVIFEIAIWASGFVIAAIITFAVKPQWENWGMLLLWHGRSDVIRRYLNVPARLAAENSVSGSLKNMVLLKK